MNLHWLKKYKLYITILFSCLLIMILFTINETNIIYILKNFLSNVEYRENFALAESTIKENLNVFEVIQLVFSEYKWTYDYMTIWGTNIFQVLIPCLSAITGLLFFNKMHTIYKIALYRSQEKNTFKFFTKEAKKDSRKMAFSIFLSYLTFSFICLFISKGARNLSISRELFLDLLGDRFYYNHTYIYYLLEGFIRFYIVPFIYSMFSCALSLMYNNKKQVFFAPIVYYFGLTLFSLALQYIIGNFAIYINPTTIMVSGSYENINTINTNETK